GCSQTGSALIIEGVAGQDARGAGSDCKAAPKISRSGPRNDFGGKISPERRTACCRTRIWLFQLGRAKGEDQREHSRRAFAGGDSQRRSRDGGAAVARKSEYAAHPVMEWE